MSHSCRVIEVARALYIDDIVGLSNEAIIYFLHRTNSKLPYVGCSK